MRRSSVLSLVVKECQKQGQTGLLGELLIIPTEESFRAKRRSIFIVGATLENLEAIVEQSRVHLGANPDYIPFLVTHGTIEAPSFSEDHIPLSDMKLENNWRCRLVRLNQINFLEVDPFNKLVMSATWRIIVTRKAPDYFVRHDIFPVLWSPGYSVGGFESFDRAISNEMKFFENRESRHFDIHNDILKIFAGDAGGTFNEVPVLTGNRQLMINSIQNHPGQYKDQIVNAINTHFTNV